MVAWNAKTAANPADKTYPNLKAHFVTAYDAHLESGPTAGTAGYHGAAAAAALSDDDSLESISNSIAQMQMGNNTGIRAINDSMTNSNAKLRQALSNTNQLVADLVRAVNAAHAAHVPRHHPWNHQMSPDQYYAAAATGQSPFYPPPPPAYNPGMFQAGYGGGRGRGRGRGRGGGRGGRGRRARGGGIGFQPSPPAQNNCTTGQTVQTGCVPTRVTPAPGYGGDGRGGAAPNPYKRWNNWNACYSCGFDVPRWHTSTTCPQKCRKEDHQEGYMRDQYDQYVAAGWSLSKTKKHKKYLPIPGTELGE